MSSGQVDGPSPRPHRLEPHRNRDLWAWPTAPRVMLSGDQRVDIAELVDATAKAVLARSGPDQTWPREPEPALRSRTGHDSIESPLFGRLNTSCVSASVSAGGSTGYWRV